MKKMKMQKRPLALMLAILMCLSGIPNTAFAASTTGAATTTYTANQDTDVVENDDSSETSVQDEDVPETEVSEEKDPEAVYPLSITMQGESLSGIAYGFDKESYVRGDMITATLTPTSGYAILTDSITLTSSFMELNSGDGTLTFSGECTVDEATGVVTVTFPVPDYDISAYGTLDVDEVTMSAEQKELRNITFAYENLDGDTVNESESKVTGTYSPEIVYDGCEVTVDVSAETGVTWGVRAETADGDTVTPTTSGNTVTFTMPDADVTITLYEKEGTSVVDPDLADGSSDISGEVDEEIAALGGGTEPMVNLSKSAVWTDIENGLANLTITEQDTDKQSNIPTNYIIALDKTRTMSLNSATFENGSDTYNAALTASSASYVKTNSPCLNPNHKYFYRDTQIRYVDYENAYLVNLDGSLGSGFVTERVSSRLTEHWKYHTDAAEKTLAPLYKNGCTDRLTIAKNSLVTLVENVKAQMQVLNNPEIMSTFTYWGFADDNSAYDATVNSGVGNYSNRGIYHFVEKSTDYDAVINKIKHTGTRSGTYYLPSFDLAYKLIKSWKDKGDKAFTKFLFISDGVESGTEYHLDTGFSAPVTSGVQTTLNVANQIKALSNDTTGTVKIYTLCIGYQEGTTAAKVLKNLASSDCATAFYQTLVAGKFNTEFMNSISSMDKEGDRVSAADKTITDYISKYYELEGIKNITITDKTGSVTTFDSSKATVADNGNKWTITYGGASYTLTIDKNKDSIVWDVPNGSSTTYAATFEIKLKDEYRYLLSDTTYPTNADAESEGKLKITYKIDGGPYSGQERSGDIGTPNLKYGTVQFEGDKNWTVSDSYTDMTVKLTRIMPSKDGDGIKYDEANRQTVNFKHLYAKDNPDWGYAFTVRQLSAVDKYGEDTKPLIKYDNAGNTVQYDVQEEDIKYYVQLDALTKTSTKEGGSTSVNAQLYNEPYKANVTLKKIDEETGNPLSGAEFTVYQWSESAGKYVEYKGTTDVGKEPYEGGLINGNAVMTLVESKNDKGVYTSPSWLYYSTDNQGKFRIVETLAPTGYYGDWADDSTVTAESDSYADKNFYDIDITKEITSDEETGKTITISNNDKKTFDDQRVLGKLTFQKQDREAKENIAQGDATLVGATYRLYAAEDIIHQDQSDTVLYKAGDEIKLAFVGTDAETGANKYAYRDVNEDGGNYLLMETNDSTTIVVDELEIGKYYLKEESASEGYLVDPNRYEFSVNYEGEAIVTVDVKDENGNTTYPVYEQVMKQSLEFYKIADNDNDTQSSALEGAGFTLYLVSELADGRFTNVSDEDLPQAILDYYRDETTLNYEPMINFCMPAVVYADADDPDIANGRLTKEITYTLSDGSNVKVTPEDFGITNEHAYFANEVFSNEKGVVTTADVPYGRYIVVETTTPDNHSTAKVFVMNVKTDAEDGTAYGDGKGQALDQLVIERDEEINAYIRIVKTDSQSGKAVLKEGVQYLIVDLDGAWLDFYSTNKTTKEINAYKDRAAYVNENGDLQGYLVVQYSQGAYVGTADNPWTTKTVATAEDETNNTFIETFQTLPAGEYALIEVGGVPEGYIKSGYEGVISKSDETTTAENNTYYEDADTTGENHQWTDAASQGTHFVVTSSEAKYDSTVGAYVITVKQKNDPAVGKISIYKEGEFLETAEPEGTTIADRLADKMSSFLGYVKGLFGIKTENAEVTEAEVEDFKNYTFTYKKHPIAGAEFEIRAAEDIYSQEGGANATLLFAEGDLVCTLTTDENGQAWTGNTDWEGTTTAKGLPLGKYTVTEVKAGNGFALTEENAKPRTVEITYAGETVPVLYETTAYENPRQKVDLTINKTDRESGEQLSGAVFGLYAAEDIKNYNGDVVVKADTAVAVTETTLDENGKVVLASVDADLPLAKYYIKEISAPKGYATNPEKFDVDASYKEDMREVINIDLEVSNVMTAVQINLMDYYTEVELSGAVFAVQDKDGNTVAFIDYRDGEIKVAYTEKGTIEKFTTKANDNVILRGLEINTTYTLKELKNAEGYAYDLLLKEGYESVYAKASDDVVDAHATDTADEAKITFDVDNVEELQIVSVFVKPGKGEIDIVKKGEVATGTKEGEDGTLNPIYEVKGLPNTEYALVADGDIDYPDKVSGRLFNDGDIILDAYKEASDDSVLKKVYEVKAEQGTLLDVSAYIGTKYAADATQEEIDAFYNTYGNEVERQIPSETETKNGEFTYSGTALNTVIVTDDEGIARISGLPLASYKVVEVAAPDGYVRELAGATKTVDFNEVEPTEDYEFIATVEYENARQAVPENPDDQSKNATVSYLSSIHITKSASGEFFKAGDTVTYTMILANNGETTLKNVKVEDSLGGTFIAAASDDVDASKITFDGATATIGENLEPNDVITFTYQYTIPSDTKNGATINNTVKTVGTPIPMHQDENGNDIYEWDDENGIHWMDVTNYADVSDDDTAKVKVVENGVDVLKEADAVEYRPGETAHYTIYAINKEDKDLTDVKVVDSLGGTFTKADDDENVVINADGTATIKTFKAGSTVALKYAYTVPAGASEVTIPNTVTLEVYGSTIPEYPSIDIVKYALQKVYHAGDTAQYKMVVTNNGGMNLADVVVVDSLDGTFTGAESDTVNTKDVKISGNTITIGDMAIGSSVTLTYEYEIPETAQAGEEILNTVTVEGTSVPTTEGSEPTKVTDKDDETVTVITETRNPKIHLIKDVDKNVVRAGEKVTYTLTATNTGDVDLTNVTLTDTMLDLGDLADLGDMKVGESKSVSYTYTVPETAEAGDVLPNTATVVGTEVLPEGSSETPREVTDTDNEEIKVVGEDSPAISVTKMADHYVYAPGETAEFTITVINTGDVDLTTVSLNDILDKANVTLDGGYWKDDNPDCTSLNVGESATLKYLYDIPTDTEDGTIIHNTIVVDGKTHGVPHINVTKTADKTIAHVGDVVTYTVTVTNDGEVDLVDVKLSDSLVPLSEADASVGNLKVGESKTITYTMNVVETTESPIDNVVIATGEEDPDDPRTEDPKNPKEVTDEDDEEVIVVDTKIPAISITKTVDHYVYAPGETAIYTMAITNTGDVALKDVLVSDSLGGEFIDSPEIGSLAVGESVELKYAYIVPADATGEIPNTATVVGTEDPTDPNVADPENPKSVTDDDDAVITVVKPDVTDEDDDEVIVITDSSKPSISITKSVNKKKYVTGEVATYVMHVVNNGTVDLTDVVVTDSLEGVFASAESEDIDIEKVVLAGNKASLGDMKVGDEVILTYSYTVPEGYKDGDEIPNTVTVVGKEKLPENSTKTPREVTDADDEVIYVVESDVPNPKDDEIIIVRNPKIQVTKVADKKVYWPGETATYQIAVTNTGIDDLTDVVLSEKLLTGGVYTSTSKGECDGDKVNIGDLAVGEVVNITYEYKIPETAVAGTEYDNIVVVNGKTVPVVNPQNPTLPDGSPNYLPDIPVSDTDDEDVYVITRGTGLSVTKYGVDGDSRYPVAGAEYTLYAEEDVTNIFGDVVYKAGEAIETAVTGDNGVARFTVDAPVGKYRISETKAPDGYYSTAKSVIADLSFWKYNDQWTTLNYSDTFENAITQIKVLLKDDMTFNELADATLNLIDANGNEVEAWITKVSDGYVIKGLKTNTTYTIKEVVARDGYLINFTGYEIVSDNADVDSMKDASLTLTIKDVATGVTENGDLDKNTIPTATVITLLNKFVTGDIILNKDGEILSKWNTVTKIAELIKSVFTFDKSALEGVEFTVYAASDIYHPDGVTGLLYKKGDVVATHVRGVKSDAVALTNAQGVVEFSGMYLGQYNVVETKTKDGYVLDGTPKAVTLSYVDAYTDPVSAVEGTISVLNAKQKVAINILKVDAKDQNKKLSGAVFGVYAGEDIKNSAGTVIVKKDTLLETSKSGDDGLARFESNFPLASYYVKEVSAPNGYVKTDKTLTFKAEAKEGADVQTFTGTFTNEKQSGNGGGGSNPSNPSKTTTNINTGDVDLLMVVGAVAVVIAAAAVIVTVVAKNKKKSNTDAEETKQTEDK